MSNADLFTVSGAVMSKRAVVVEIDRTHSDLSTGSLLKRCSVLSRARMGVAQDGHNT
jgi:hypothetical protein